MFHMEQFREKSKHRPPSSVSIAEKGAVFTNTFPETKAMLVR